MWLLISVALQELKNNANQSPPLSQRFPCEAGAPQVLGLLLSILVKRNVH